MEEGLFDRFIPINKGVLVELVKEEEKTQGGIFIPGQAKESTQLGKVLNCANFDQVKPGDIIFYKKYTGHALNEALLVLQEEDILGIVDDRYSV